MLSRRDSATARGEWPPRMHSSLPLKLGWAFLEKGGCALGLVLRRGAEGKQHTFVYEPLRLAALESAVDRLDGPSNRERGIRLDLAENVFRARNQP
jgi:hypothetical protein